MIGWIVFGVVAFFVVFVLIISGLKLIGANQVGILTKNMFGKKMPEGQIIAREGEIGIQARTLMPGLYWRMPFVWSISKTPVVNRYRPYRPYRSDRWKTADKGPSIR
jgi:uncharacterized membrane protein YqiK